MNPLDIAITEAGGVGRLALALKVGQSTVSNWRKRGTIPSAEYCAGIEAATGGRVTRQDLRPDDWQAIWPELTPAHTQTAPVATESVVL